MFVVSKNTIHVTRGDIGSFEVSAKTHEDADLIFKVGDIVRFKVYQAGRHNLVVLEKDVVVTPGVDESQDITSVTIRLSSDETRLGDLINSPVEYWYEVELNPDTACQTIVGYDLEGPKIFKLYPEGGRQS